MTRTKSYWTSALALVVLIAGATVTPGVAQDFTVMYNFGSVSGDPRFPALGFIAQGRDGSLYTTSTSGGANEQGTVFKITPAGQMRVLYSFCSLPNCADGKQPNGGLILRPDGHFLGTTYQGGSQGFGTIFDISQTGSLTTLYNFTGGVDGGNPIAPPVLGADGSFYGTTEAGGNNLNCGTLYRITGSVLGVLHKFGGTNGCFAAGPLTLGRDGNLYGTTVLGGTSNDGVVFQMVLRPGKSTLVKVLANFEGTNGAQPFGPLLEGSDGNFYGTNRGIVGTNGFGTVFKFTPSGTLTVVQNLNGTTDGFSPYAGLVQATDGNYYGAAEQGGGLGSGTLFQINAAGNFSVIYNFDGTGGAAPDLTLFQHTNGVLYGTTEFGGTSSDAACVNNGGCGVFYSWDTGLPAFVSLVPYRAKVGSTIEILGQGFTSSSTVSFNTTPAVAVVVAGNFLRAVVPSGATTGYVTVTTSSGTLTSNKKFLVTR